MLCSEYPAEYEVFEPWAAFAQDLRRIAFAADSGLGPSPRVALVVAPRGEGTAWVGEFYGHRDGSDLVARTPDPRSLLVIAGGVAYWVPTHAPQDFMVLGFPHVRSVHCSAGSDVLIMASHSRLAAIDGGGNVAWKSPELVSDEFDEVRLTASVVVVRGYSAPDGREIEVTLDRATGTIVSTN